MERPRLKINIKVREGVFEGRFTAFSLQPQPVAVHVWAAGGLRSRPGLENDCSALSGVDISNPTPHSPNDYYWRPSTNNSENSFYRSIYDFGLDLKKFILFLFLSSVVAGHWRVFISSWELRLWETVKYTEPEITISFHPEYLSSRL